MPSLYKCCQTCYLEVIVSNCPSARKQKRLVPSGVREPNFCRMIKFMHLKPSLQEKGAISVRAVDGRVMDMVRPSLRRIPDFLKTAANSSSGLSWICRSNQVRLLRRDPL